MTALLALSGIRKAYDRPTVLHDISLRLAPGEFLLLIGGSGSGKTTLLRIAGGLERTNAGRVALRGQTVDDPRTGTFVPPERRGLGMVFQDYALWPHLSCAANVMAALPPRSPDRQNIARAMLERMHVGALADRRPAQLSGGQQQRVGIARALAARPDLLLLDEPLSSLDPHVRDRLRQEIRALARESNIAALIVSHDPTDIWRLADRVAVLEAGRITQEATPEILFHAPATPRVARFSGAQGGFPAVPAIDAGHAGIRFGTGFLPARIENFRAEAALVAFIHPRDVKAGPENATGGVRATLMRRNFEAGAWLAHWRIDGLDMPLCSLEPAPPPAVARLTIAPDRIHLYPKAMNDDAA
jgi:iron(III) transport system ATP-binding protein